MKASSYYEVRNVNDDASSSISFLLLQQIIYYIRFIPKPQQPWLARAHHKQRSPTFELTPDKVHN